MVAWRESFAGADSALTTTDNGLPWQLVRGSVAQRAERGYAQPVSPGPFAVVDSGSQSEDGVLETTRPGGFGHALYFRVVDVSNHWRAYTRRTSRQVAVGTTQVYAGTEQYVIGYGTYPTEYEWIAHYNFHPDGDNFGLHTVIRWGETQPFFPSSLAHNHYHHPYGPDSDIITHYHSLSSVGRTGNTRGGGSYPIYGTRDVYRTVTVYETQYDHRLRLEVVEAGTGYLVHEVPVSDAGAGAMRLRVEFSGESILAYGDLADPASSTGHPRRTAHLKARRHGFGFAEGTLNPYTLGIGPLTFTPGAGGIYTPTAML